MFTKNARRAAVSLFLSFGTIGATVTPIPAQPDSLPGRSDTEADQASGSRFRPGSEITVTDYATDGPREPGEAPDVSVLLDEDGRSVRVGPDDVLVPAEPVADGLENLVETETIAPSPRTPREPGDDGGDVEAGFVPGESVYQGAQADGHRHVWFNPDGTITVMYAPFPSVADPDTGELTEDRPELSAVENGRIAAVTDLVLPVRVLRLQVPESRGQVMDSVVPTKESKGPITMTTSAEIIYQRRVRLLALAEELGNISAACRQLGISRTRYYQWRSIAENYGIQALWPKDRRRPNQPNETPTLVVHDLMTILVIEPTIGCRQYADRLGELGYDIGKSTVQRILVAHGLGKRRQRVAQAAAIAALSGLVTEPATREPSPFGFCHWAAQPGDLVALDSFYIGKLKGVGKVYQLTAVDTATRWAITKIVIGPVNASHTISFIAHVRKLMRRLGWPVRRVLTDNGPEYVARIFQDHLAEVGIDHARIPPRSPNHNAVCERFQGTMLQECWRPAFHRRHFGSIRQLQTEADAWLVRYNTRRCNHGDFMRGRTPKQLLDNHRKTRTS